MTLNIDKYFRVERHGTFGLIVALPQVDKLLAHELHYAGPELMASLKENPPNGIVIDLEQVKFYQSALFSFLLRCHTLTKKYGMEKMVLAVPSNKGRELLSFLSLDKIWEIYGTAGEALQALASSK